MLVGFVPVAVVVAADESPQEAKRDWVQSVLETTGVKGGLIVHLPCGDGLLTAALRAGDSYVVHGLDTDSAEVDKTRQYAESRGVYGKVSADVFDGKRLPYADNLVNLLVSEDLGEVAMAEVLRVLVPRGVAYVKQGDTWTRTKKPWPDEIDQWTHYLHGPDGNAVSHDSTIGVSRSLRWIAAPLWARHHDFAPSLSALVSAGGRIFYIIDEAPPGIAGMPGKWFLVARDAFNGVLLWKQPIESWGWEHWTRNEVHTFNRQNTPFELTRRLVAADDYVYVTLGYNAPVSKIDARSGELIQSFQQTRNACGIIHHDGRLILTVTGEPQRVLAPGEQRSVGKAIVVLDPISGTTLWRKGGYAAVKVRANSERNSGTLFVCAGDRYVFLLEEDAVVCLSLADGAERWRVPRPGRKKQPLRSRIHLSDLGALVYQEGMLYFGQLHPNSQANKDGDLQKQILRMTLLAIDIDTGRIQWQFEGAGITCSSPPDLFVHQGLVWIYKPGEPTLLGLDARDGKVVKSIPVDKVLRTHHHHRCYANKATSRYILTAKEGIEYVDIQSGEIATCHWVRGVCRYGIMPANGLIYAPPHQCGCFIDAKLNGFLALATTGDKGRTVGEDSPQTPRLQLGPAYVRSSTSQWSAPTPDDWPMYRKDIRRSGFIASKLSEKLKHRWEARIGAEMSGARFHRARHVGNVPHNQHATVIDSPHLTGVTVVGEKVFVASADAHAVYCLNAESGEVRWKFTAGARVDTPPTYWRGRVLFGSHDGFVYCLNAVDGARVWRFRAAPDESRIVALGQLESPWPVHGSVLVLDGRAYFTAGRSAHLDSGMVAYCLDVETGKVLQETRLLADTTSKGELAGAALSDLLVSDGATIWMRKRRFDPQDISRPAESAALPPVHATAGLLDDSWFNRTFWSYEGKCPAQYLVFDDKTVYGIRAYRTFFWKSFNDAFQPAKEGYQLFADDIEKLDSGRKGKDKRRNRTPVANKWSIRIPVRAQAMVVTDHLLFVAGVPDVVDEKDPWAAFEGRTGGVLYVFSKSDGKKLAQYGLPAPPVYDGMAVSQEQLYLALKSGNVICFASRSR